MIEVRLDLPSLKRSEPSHCNDDATGFQRPALRKTTEVAARRTPRNWARQAEQCCKEPKERSSNCALRNCRTKNLNRNGYFMSFAHSTKAPATPTTPWNKFRTQTHIPTTRPKHRWNTAVPQNILTTLPKKASAALSGTGYGTFGKLCAAPVALLPCAGIPCWCYGRGSNCAGTAVRTPSGATRAPEWLLSDTPTDTSQHRR